MGFLTFANDLHVELLARQNDRFDGVGQLVDVKNRNTLDLRNAIKIVIIGQKLSLKLLRQTNQLRVDRRADDAASSDASRLNRIFAGRDSRAVFMFAVDGPGKLYSRMFAPHLQGISEDAATGSAAGPLGAFAVKHGLVPRAGTVSLTNEQGTKMGRQSFLHIELAYGVDRDIPTKIEVGGSVVPIVSGELTLPEASR